ncbi:hypothetical protein CVS40_11362 [Lucilia cuprina]|nr:hypothetical protein CVS40_11362 [Lucilia cuprina]
MNEADIERYNIMTLKAANYLNLNFFFKKEHRRRNHTFQYIVFRYKDFYIFILYRNIEFPERTFRQLLVQGIDELKRRFCAGNNKIILVGDFNLCRKTANNESENINALTHNGIYISFREEKYHNKSWNSD